MSKDPCDPWKYLDFAVSEATNVLCALHSCTDVPGCHETQFLALYLRVVSNYHAAKNRLSFLPDAAVSRGAVPEVPALTAYQASLEAAVPAVVPGSSGGSSSSSSNNDTSESTWPLLLHFRDAAQAATRLMRDPSTGVGTGGVPGAQVQACGSVPVRFQLHFVELCISLEALYGVFLDGRNQDRFTPEGIDKDFSGVSPPPSLFARDAALLLSDMLLSALTSPSTDRLTANATAHDVGKLRRGVLHLASSGVMLDNANSGTGTSTGTGTGTGTDRQGGEREVEREVEKESGLRKHARDEWQRMHRFDSFCEAEQLLTTF
jgi:hypothetical protein